MQKLKYLFFLLIISIIGLSIYVAVQPNEFKVSRSRIIKAPAAVIYNHVIDFKTWESWSSWVESDPNMKIMLSSQTKGINGSYSWEDQDGIGHIKTIQAKPYSTIQQHMQFNDFPPSNIHWDFKSKPDGSTNVTWNITGENLPFSFKMFSIIMGGMEKQIGPHYNRSLEKLDSIVVSNMKKFTIKVDGITEYGGGFYMYKTTSTTSLNIEKTISNQFDNIKMYMSNHAITQTGKPFTMYHNMKSANGIIMSQAIPVQNKVTVTGNSQVLCGYIPKTKVLKTTLKGNYSYLKKAWKTAYQYLTEQDLKKPDMFPFEIYQTDPTKTPNPADWITEIYIPIN